MTDEKKSLLERLTPEQRDRLQALVTTISYDKLTVSFSLDDRDSTGRKRSAFYSLTVSRDAREETAEKRVPGFSVDETRVVRCLLSKQVVSTVYDDAVKRGMLPRSQAGEELRPILEAYDVHIAKLLAGEGNGS
jgi:hypothetical protein